MGDIVRGVRDPNVNEAEWQQRQTLRAPYRC